MTVIPLINSDIGIDPRINLKSAKKSIISIDVKGMINKVVQSFGVINVKLEALDDTDEINGFVSVDEKDGITVGIYEADELPNSDHKTTLKKPTVVPTLATIDEMIQNAINNL